MKYTVKGKLEYKPLVASFPAREYSYTVSVSNHWWAIEIVMLTNKRALNPNEMASLKVWGDGKTMIHAIRGARKRDTGEEGSLTVYESDAPKGAFGQEAGYLWLALASTAYLDQVQTNRLRMPWSDSIKTTLAEWKRFDDQDRLPTSMDYYFERPSGFDNGDTNNVKRLTSYRTSGVTRANGKTFPKEFVFHAYEPFPSPHFAKPGEDLEVYRVSGSVEFVSSEVDQELVSPVFKGFAQVVDRRLGRESVYWLKNLAPLSMETLKTRKYSGEY